MAARRDNRSTRWRCMSGRGGLAPARSSLASRARGVGTDVASPVAAWKRDIAIALRRRLGRDPDGRGTAWIAQYGASSPGVLATEPPAVWS